MLDPASDDSLQGSVSMTPLDGMRAPVVNPGSMHCTGAPHFEPGIQAAQTNACMDKSDVNNLMDITSDTTAVNSRTCK